MGHITNLGKPELESMLDDIIDMNEGGFIDTLLAQAASDATREDMMSDYIITMTRYYMYLKAYQLEEDYEMCAKIQKAIGLEEAHYLGIITQFCAWSQPKADKQLIKEIRNEFRSIYNV